MLVLIDNYDSFTWNLVQYFGDLGEKVKVFRNDKISINKLIDMKPSAIVISPGPGTPDKAGICLELVRTAEKTDIPLLGVCLGHQAIGQAFGGKITRAPEPVHGKTSSISHSNENLFKHIPSPFIATRYHSLIIDRQSIPEALSVTAETEDGIIMGVKYRDKNIFGLQFHPESIATEHGHALLENFITLVRGKI